MSQKAPCYQCAERYMGCHAACQRYKEWRWWLDGKNKEYRRERCTAGYQQDKMEWIRKKLRRMKQKMKKKTRLKISAACVALGWITLAGLACSAETLIDTLPGWGLALGLAATAFGLMELGQVLRRRA